MTGNWWVYVEEKICDTIWQLFAHSLLADHHQNHQSTYPSMKSNPVEHEKGDANLNNANQDITIITQADVGSV